MKVQRVCGALGRRARLWVARGWFRRARFGAACDIRSGLKLRLAPGARLEIGRGCVLDHEMTIECNGTLLIGDRVIFGHHCTLAAFEHLEIGDDTLIAELVSIRDHDHDFADLEIPIREQGALSIPTFIGRNVWLGAKVTVLKGVRIGDGAIVGANAVVTRDIPANAIAVGVPARVIRMRGAPPETFAASNGSQKVADVTN